MHENIILAELVWKKGYYLLWFLLLLLFLHSFCAIFKRNFGNLQDIFNWFFRCEAGLVPMPDSIEGCVECLIDSDCDYGSICEVQWNKCIPKPDPCNPSPCGPGARCMEDHNGNAVCRFLVEK